MPAGTRRKRGRHQAPSPRPVVLPALLLVSAGAAFAGLTLMPASASGVPQEPADVLAIGGPDPMSDLIVTLADPTPEPAVPSPAVTAAAAAKKSAVATAVKKAAAAKKARASRSIRRAAFVQPCSGHLTSGYGRRWGQLHAGLDFGAPIGTPIHAVAAGVVKETKTTSSSGGYGNLTILEHDDGTLTYYGHQSKFLVNEGDEVGPGDVIGLVGSTGHSTGPHLHFEVHPDGGAAIDPKPWLREHGLKA